MVLLQHTIRTKSMANELPFMSNANMQFDNHTLELFLI